MSKRFFKTKECSCIVFAIICDVKHTEKGKMYSIGGHNHFTICKKCKELESLKIPSTLNKVQQDMLEFRFSRMLKKEFPEVSYAKVVKSSSGVSVRAYIRLELSYNGRHIKTDVNLRDRTGLSCEMLVGLRDML